MVLIQTLHIALESRKEVMIIVVSMLSCNLRGKDKSQKTVKMEKLELGLQWALDKSVGVCNPSHTQLDLRVCGRMSLQSHALNDKAWYIYIYIYIYILYIYILYIYYIYIYLFIYLYNWFFHHQKTDAKAYWSTTERGRKAEDKLIESPYDIESWGTLVREAQVSTFFNII